MDNYKMINKELIDQVREMRSEIAIYKQEIVEHKAEIMEQHRLRVEQKNTFLALLTQNFRTFLNDIDPELNIQNLLGNTDNNREENHINNKDISQRTRKSRSSKILMDFRRRSSTLQPRLGSLKMSPAYRRSMAPDIEQNETSLESDDIQSISDNSVNISKEDDLEEAVETLQEALRLNSIVEEDTFEQMTPKKVVSTLEKQAKTRSAKKQSSLLRDITNMETSAADSPLVMKRHVKNLSCFEDSIEAPRFVNEIDIYTIDNNTINSINLAISELSIENIFQAPCSTPASSVEEKRNYNFRDKTAAKSTIENIMKENQSTNDSTLFTSSNCNSRPQRNRIKINYAEPTLKEKMRADIKAKKQKKKSARK